MLIPDAIYTRTEVEKSLRIGGNTLTLWIALGLKVYKPGTAAHLFHGSEVIAFIRDNPTLKNKPKNAKERRALMASRYKG